MKFRLAKSSNSSLTDDATIKAREIDVKEADLALRKEELGLKRREQALSRWRNPLVVAIMAGVVAAAANILINAISHHREVEQAKLKYDQAREEEQRKHEQARADERERRLTANVSELASILTKGYQKQSWLLWTAEAAPQSMSAKMLTDYDESMKVVFPAAIASHISIGIQDRELYLALAPLVKELGDIDAELTSQLLKAKSDFRRGRVGLARLNDRAQESTAMLGRRISSAYLGLQFDPVPRSKQASRAPHCLPSSAPNASGSSPGFGSVCQVVPP